MEKKDKNQSTVNHKGWVKNKVVCCKKMNYFELSCYREKNKNLPIVIIYTTRLLFIFQMYKTQANIRVTIFFFSHLARSTISTRVTDAGVEGSLAVLSLCNNINQL